MELKHYQRLAKQVEALISGEKDQIANFANISAILNMELDNINWVGFYIYDGKELVLGPFQGLPACIRIQVEKGVCGTAFSENIIQRVADVHAFPGHIACDAASNSEIVLPINVAGKTIAVLDIDSPNLDRFTEIDEQGLSVVVATIEKCMNS